MEAFEALTTVSVFDFELTEECCFDFGLVWENFGFMTNEIIMDRSVFEAKIF